MDGRESRFGKKDNEAEMIRAYIYSKNFAGIGEASCVLDADKVAALLAGVSAAETAGEPAAGAGESAGAAPAPDDLPARITFRTRQPGDRQQVHPEPDGG